MEGKGRTGKGSRGEGRTGERRGGEELKGGEGVGKECPTFGFKFTPLQRSTSPKTLPC